MNFEFFVPTKIIFGIDSFKDINKYILEFGTKPLFVINGYKRYLDQIAEKMNSDNIPFEYFTISREPNINDVQEGLNVASNFGCDVIISIGGGSVIDAGKAISAFITNRGDITDYLEVIGKGKPITEKPLPFIAIPSTAGTGSEVTSNAVLASTQKMVKISVRSLLMFPRLALIDPVLSKSMPPLITAGSGLDALIQLFEVYISNKANPITDAVCKKGLQLAIKSLRKAYLDGNDINARADMSIAAAFSGIALANAKLGAVHGIAGPLGGMIDIPHGIACASLFLQVFKINLAALLERDPGSQALGRFKEFCTFLLNQGSEISRIEVGTEDYVPILKDFLDVFNIPKLSNYGLTKNQIPNLVEKSKNSSSMKGNPIKLSEGEIWMAIEESL